nr:unnamed protein product [Digitaria exilis]
MLAVAAPLLTSRGGQVETLLDPHDGEVNVPTVLGSGLTLAPYRRREPQTEQARETLETGKRHPMCRGGEDFPKETARVG